MTPDIPDFSTYQSIDLIKAKEKMQTLLGEKFIATYKPPWLKKGFYFRSFNFGYEFTKSDNKLKGIIVEIDTPLDLFEVNERDFSINAAQTDLEKMQKAIINGFLILRVFIYDISNAACRQKLEQLKSITSDYNMYNSFDWVASDYNKVNSRYKLYEESLKQACAEFYHEKPCDLFKFAKNKTESITNNNLIIRPFVRKLTKNENSFLNWLEKYYFNDFTWQFAPNWAINKKQLRYDFVHKNINLIIELDDETHFTLPECVERDMLKNKLAINNNYKLIRVPLDFLFDKHDNKNIWENTFKTIIDYVINGSLTDNFITFPSRLKKVNEIYKKHREKLIEDNINIVQSQEINSLYENMNLKEDATIFATFFTYNNIQPKSKRVQNMKRKETIHNNCSPYRPIWEWLNETYNYEKYWLIQDAQTLIKTIPLLWSIQLHLDCIQTNEKGKKRLYSIGSSALKILITCDKFFFNNINEDTRTREKEKDRASIANGYTCIHFYYDLLNKGEDWKTQLKIIIDKIIDKSEQKKLIWLPTGIQEYDEIYQQFENDLTQ